MSWHEDGHSAALFIDDEVMRVKLQCPGPDFCEAKQRCHVCEGARVVTNGPHDTEPTYTHDPCEHCKGSGDEPGTCHLLDWAENVCPMELHHGHTDLYGQTFPAAIRWDYGDYEEGPNWRFAVTYPDERTEDAAAA